MAQLNFEQTFDLALAHHRAGRLTEAIDGYRFAAQLRPSAAVYNNLAVACREAGLTQEATAAFQQAIALAPQRIETRLNYANLLREEGNLDNAITVYREALKLNPGFAPGLSNLGAALQDAGQVSEAIECYRRAIEIDPTTLVAHSNLLYAMHFDPRFDAQTILAEHRRWNQIHAQPLKSQIRPHENDRSRDRPLRIGYVSAHFHDHVIGRFMHPLLRSHDPSQFQTFCYSDTTGMPPHWQSIATTWRSIRQLSDEQLAELVRHDRIDILVDLNLHMSGSRLLAFARKPAPVQVTYLAYCSTSGLDAINDRLTDPHLDPPGETDALYSERSVRLPETYWCYEPIGQLPEPGSLPASSNGFITFGSFNHFAKVSELAVRLWAKLLRQIPNSRLILHSRPGSHRQRLTQLLASQSVDPACVTFTGFVPAPQYFEQYRQIDIALDPFPYAGGTTTCDALWMGVPVVTLRGRTAVGRGGVSILSNIGLPQLIAADEDQYLRIATGLAADFPRLKTLRSSLRDRMKSSPLTNAPRFAKNVEAAFREMWRGWCASTDHAAHFPSPSG